MREPRWLAVAPAQDEIPNNLALQKFPRYVPESHGEPYISQAPTPLHTPPRLPSPGVPSSAFVHSPLAQSAPVGSSSAQEGPLPSQSFLESNHTHLGLDPITESNSSYDSFDLSRTSTALFFDFSRKGPLETKVESASDSGERRNESSTMGVNSEFNSKKQGRHPRRSSFGEVTLSFQSHAPRVTLGNLSEEMSLSESLLHRSGCDSTALYCGSKIADFTSVTAKRDIFLGGIDSLNIALENHRGFSDRPGEFDNGSGVEIVMDNPDNCDVNDEIDSSSSDSEVEDSADANEQRLIDLDINPTSTLERETRADEPTVGPQKDLETSRTTEIGDKETEQRWSRDPNLLNPSYEATIRSAPSSRRVSRKSIQVDSDAPLRIPRLEEETQINDIQDQNTNLLGGFSNPLIKPKAGRFSSRAKSAPIKRQPIQISTSCERDSSFLSADPQNSSDLRSDKELDTQDSSSPSRRENIFFRIFHPDSPRTSSVGGSLGGSTSLHGESRPSPLFQVNGKDDHGNPTSYQVVQYPHNGHQRDPSRRLDSLMAKLFSLHHQNAGSWSRSGNIGQPAELENDASEGGSSTAFTAGGPGSPGASPPINPFNQRPIPSFADSESLPPAAINHTSHHNLNPFNFLKHHSHDTPVSPTASPGSDLSLFKDLLTNRHRRTHSNIALSHSTHVNSGIGSPSPSTPDDQNSPKISKRSLSEVSIQEKYGKVDEVLGKGASATVRLYHKLDEFKGSEKLYAVKEFRKRRRGELPKDYVKKVIAEFCISSSMHHENVIETVDLIQDEHDRWCEVMEYMPGGDLYTRISQNQLVDFDEINCFFKQLMAGVVYIHSVGVAHRDLKPENLLLDAESRILKIADFGVSEVFKTCFEKSSRKAKGVCGSEPYIAPEEWEDDAEYDGSKVDIWACGIIYYTMLYNSVPWRVARQTDSHYHDYISHRKPEYQTGYSPFDRLHPGPRNLFYKILEPDPTKRPTAQIVLDDPWLTSQEVCRAKGFDSHDVAPVRHTHHPHPQP